MIGKDVALKPDGSAVAVQANGIALSPDAQWLYYRPLTDHNYWRLPTAALRDEKLLCARSSEAVLGRRLRDQPRLSVRLGFTYGKLHLKTAFHAPGLSRSSG
jgi:hypothetical protein